MRSAVLVLAALLLTGCGQSLRVERHAGADGLQRLVLQERNGPSMHIQMRPTRRVLILPRAAGVVMGSETRLDGGSEPRPAHGDGPFGGFIVLDGQRVQLHLLEDFGGSWLPYRHNGTYRADMPRQ